MKRINLILISIALPALFLAFGAAVVSAKGESETKPTIISMTLSAETIYPGEIVAATAVFTPLIPIDNYQAYIDWGNGVIDRGEVTQENDLGIVSGKHLYTEPGHYTVVFIVIKPDGERDTASASIDVLKE